MNEIITKPPAAPSPALIDRFIAIVGDKIRHHRPAGAGAIPARDERDLYRGHTPVVLRPGSTAEVAAIVKLANETGTAIVPQGGNTGLVGGQIPIHGEIVLSLNRLDQIREVDPTSNTMTCEAGVTLQRAREAAAEVDRLFPLLARRRKAPAPSAAISRPMPAAPRRSPTASRARTVLGLEVVLADGRVLNNLNKLKKDNTGYDLKNLFIGAEGTLGIITAAVLRLFPRPRAVETAFVGVPSPRSRARTCSTSPPSAPAARDQFRNHAADRARPGGRARPPAAAIRSPAQHPWYVLIELSSQARDGLRANLEDILARRHRARA